MATFDDSEAPSSPLSMKSRSPTPPCDYPSPSSTGLSSSRASSRSHDIQPDVMDSPRPTKRRKLNEPKERTTEHLDLSSFNSAGLVGRDDIQLQRLLRTLRTKQKIVVIAGAGISVSAGIPDFRSSSGLFKTLKTQHNLKSSGKDLFDASVYRSDDSTTSFHSMVRELSQLTRNAKPTRFHHLLATLASENRLLRLYSQNVDGIDTALEPLATKVPLPPKGPWPQTIQLHGGLDKMVCTKCGHLSKFESDLFDGPAPPSCGECAETDRVRTQLAGKRSHGIGRLRPRMVLYNEFNPDEDAIGAVSAADLRSRPDAVIVVGTTLKVPGIRRIAREMCQVTRGRRDGFTCWINFDPEPIGIEFKDCWDLIVRGSCDEVAHFANLPKWDDNNVGDFKDVTFEEVKNARARGDVKIEFPNKAVEQIQGMVTPTASPKRQSPVPPVSKSTGIRIKLPGLDDNIMQAGVKAKGTQAKKAKPKKAKNTKNVPVKRGNQITALFSVSKGINVAAPKSQKPDNAIGQRSCSANQSVKSPTPSSQSPMQPIPSHDSRHNSEALGQPHHEHTKYLDKDAKRPVSPYEKEAFQRAQTATVSPQSVPRNMEDLID